MKELPCPHIEPKFDDFWMITKLDGRIISRSMVKMELLSNNVDITWCDSFATGIGGHGCCLKKTCKTYQKLREVENIT